MFIIMFAREVVSPSMDPALACHGAATPGRSDACVRVVTDHTAAQKSQAPRASKRTVMRCSAGRIEGGSFGESRFNAFPTGNLFWRKTFLEVKV